MKPLPFKRIAQLAIGLGLAGFFVWLVVRNLDGAELARAFSAARPGWIALAVLFFLAGYACRIARWRQMLLPDSPALGWGPIAVAFWGSIAANNVLPFRAGDALRVFGFASFLGVPVATMLATLLVERLLDLLSLLIAFGIVLLVLPLADGAAASLVGLGGAGLVFAGVAVLAVLLLPQMFEPLARFVLAMLGRVAPGVAGKLGTFVESIFATLRHLSRGPRMLLLAFWSAGAWALEGAVFWACAHAVPAMAVPAAGWLAFPVGTLSTLLPSTPGYVGTFDFFVIKAAELMGNGAGAATAFALLVHLVIWLPATLIGGLALLAWHLVRPSPVTKRAAS